jgi:hypothetical protein
MRLPRFVVMTSRSLSRSTHMAAGSCLPLMETNTSSRLITLGFWKALPEVWPKTYDKAVECGGLRE